MSIVAFLLDINSKILRNIKNEDSFYYSWSPVVNLVEYSNFLSLHKYIFFSFNSPLYFLDLLDMSRIFYDMIIHGSIKFLKN